MADPVLCLVTTKTILGMQIWNLRKVPVVSNWEELPFPQIEFQSEVPHPQQDEIPDLKGAFLMEKEAKLYLAGVTTESELFSPWDWNICNKTYLFDVESKEIMVTDSIVEPPGVMVESFIACIDGDTYFLKCSGKTSELGFWVLKNAEDWEPLSLPFDANDLDLLAKSLSFVNLDRIYLQVSINRKTKVFFFDTKMKTWKEEGAKMVMDSFNHPVFGYCLPTCFVNVEGLSSPTSSIGLSWLSLPADEDTSGDWANMIVCALFVNDEGVAFYQPINEWFGEFQPTFLRRGCFSKFIDLGNGMVCALLCGKESEHGDTSVLCISILTFTMHDGDGDLNIHAASPPPQQKKFLTVTVLRRGAFNMDGYIHEDNSLLDAFICPLDPVAIMNSMFNSTMKLDLDKVPEEWYSRRPEEAGSSGTSGLDS